VIEGGLGARTEGQGGGCGDVILRRQILVPAPEPTLLLLLVVVVLKPPWLQHAVVRPT
jgi:hypothetical protein